MSVRRSGLVVVASLVWLEACGGAAGSPKPAPAAAPPADDGSGDDTGKAAIVDHGQVSEVYPAFTPEVGQLTNNGGDTLKSPVIVTVTWPNEAYADKFETFGDLIGQSAYWSAIVGEYGVSAAVSGATNHVRMKDALGATVDSTGVDGIVSTSTQDAATSGWPAPTEQTIYVLYLPVGTSLDLGGGADACSVGVGGYHDSTRITTPDGKTMDVAYAVIPQCRANDLDDSTESSSHEIAEAALDPHPSQNPGYVGFDDGHLAWEYFQQFQSENGDDCEFYRDSFYTSTSADLPFAVQRQWSNKSALAGHAPCVPAPAGPYFNVTPLLQEDIQVDLTQYQGSSKQATKGFHAAVGEQKSFSIGFYSDGPTDAWTIDAREGTPFGPSPSTTHRLDITLDKKTGRNGEKALVTVKVNQIGRSKGELITIVSTLGSKKHYMPILIGSM